MVIAAPTASGKTALVNTLFGRGSLFEFKNYAEIISCDSQAVYTSLDIGTAKPTAQERAEIPYHLIDVASPFEQFGLGEFMSLAEKAAFEIWEQKKIPVMVGGTGFYIRSFLTGAPCAPESSPEVREKIFNRLKCEGAASLYKELCALDPAYAKKIHPNDEYRICRALEVFYTGGKPLSSYKIPNETRKGYTFLTIILERERKDLYQRIDRRVDELFDAGLPQEIEKLKKMGCTKDTPAIKAIGYREFFDPSLTTEEEIKKAIKHSSHRYAKRQITYLQNIPGAKRVNADDIKTVENLAREFFLCNLRGL